MKCIPIKMIFHTSHPKTQQQAIENDNQESFQTLIESCSIVQNCVFHNFFVPQVERLFVGKSSRKIWPDALRGKSDLLSDEAKANLCVFTLLGDILPSSTSLRGDILKPASSLLHLSLTFSSSILLLLHLSLPLSSSILLHISSLVLFSSVSSRFSLLETPLFCLACKSFGEIDFLGKRI